MHRKRRWAYVVVIVAVIVLVILLAGKGKNSSNNLQNNSNASASAPSQTNPPATVSPSTPKTNATLSYNLDWQKYSIDMPNNIVYMIVTGNYNAFNISAQTQVSQITFTGAFNKVTICQSSYPNPAVNAVGLNNQVSYAVC